MITYQSIHNNCMLMFMIIVLMIFLSKQYLTFQLQRRVHSIQCITLSVYYYSDLWIPSTFKILIHSLFYLSLNNADIIIFFKQQQSRSLNFLKLDSIKKAIFVPSYVMYTLLFEDNHTKRLIITIYFFFLIILYYLLVFLIIKMQLICIL